MSTAAKGRAEALARELRARVARLPVANTPALRTVRRGFSRELRREVDLTPALVLDIAHALLGGRGGDGLRFVAYEIVVHHRPTFEGLSPAEVLELGEGIDSWGAVDCYALYLSGPVWHRGGLADSVIVEWTRSPNRWFRRAALVSTVALSRGGTVAQVRKVVAVCAALVGDRDDMVVKALSWSLRELAKTHPARARAFLLTYRSSLAPRVIREVEHKLTTGVKTGVTTGVKIRRTRDAER
jgi:3-methyladenine DNA glycosylase AlkD